MTYINPSWIELLLTGGLLKIGLIIMTLFLTMISFKLLYQHFTHKKITKETILTDEVSLGKTIILSVIIFIVLLVSLQVVGGYIWNNAYEQPSVRCDTITISDIQPRPGAVQIDKNGYTISNTNQLLFVTVDGKEFCNNENMYFNKFETRTIFNQLRINGTYKIKYYGWRNGYSNEFPNILSVEEVINENNTQPNDWNEYFGHNYGNKQYDIGVVE